MIGTAVLGEAVLSTATVSGASVPATRDMVSRGEAFLTINTMTNITESMSK